jgi:hypothetical protein
LFRVVAAKSSEDAREFAPAGFIFIPSRLQKKDEKPVEQGIASEIQKAVVDS